MELKLEKFIKGSLELSLLIVPYGIETPLIYHDRRTSALLIVPYGIETKLLEMYQIIQPAFNRTLWN